ncbi:signal peptidase I [Lachnospiraceae bacterium ZAX-1]
MGKRKTRGYKIKNNRSRKASTGGLSFGRKKKKVNLSFLRELFIWALEIVITIAIAGVLVFYIAYRVPVVGQSMSDTLENGQQIFVNCFVYKLRPPKKNDIIVFLPNGNDKSHYYIKRVIAVPGERVVIKDGIIYVNDEPFEEKMHAVAIDNAMLAEEEITVGEDEYFVLGDNRNNSEDSRFANIGNVKKEHIIGKAWFSLYPWDKFGFL